jgi:predicted NUDIX family NTP pyrophosphohydrolase
LGLAYSRAAALIGELRGLGALWLGSHRPYQIARLHLRHRTNYSRAPGRAFFALLSLAVQRCANGVIAPAFSRIICFARLARAASFPTPALTACTPLLRTLASLPHFAPSTRATPTRARFRQTTKPVSYSGVCVTGPRVSRHKASCKQTVRRASTAKAMHATRVVTARSSCDTRIDRRRNLGSRDQAPRVKMLGRTWETEARAARRVRTAQRTARGRAHSHARSASVRPAIL